MPAAPVFNLDRSQFLERHWQRQALFMPRAVPDFAPPISSHELAGLAMESEIESRIVRYQNDKWSVAHGPFAEGEFQQSSPFTLLVQAVDHYVDAVAELRRWVDFIPQWRIDDVMVSYGNDGASVGPHFDNYDVFLLQGEGEKRWRIGQRCDAHAPLLSHPELRILAEFETQEEFLLRTGDVLYVPPGVAHWGIAQGDSTTFSIGFRAPRLNDMLSRWADEQLEALEGDQFFGDAGRTQALPDGEILPEDQARAAEGLRELLNASLESGRWFGELVTEPRYELQLDPAELEQCMAQLASGHGLALDPSAKLAWQRLPQGPVMYANGRSFPLSVDTLPAVRQLCQTWRLEPADIATCLQSLQGKALLGALLEVGCVNVIE